LAIEQSERVTCLINIASSPRFLHTDQWPGVSSEVFIGFYNNLLAAPEFTLKEFMQLNGLSFESINYDLSGRLPTPQSLGAGLKILESWDLREQLTTFGKPSCFMFGRLDPIVPIKTLNFMQITYPGFHYILFKRAAHMPFLSHMDLFIEELRGFIHFNKSREITSS
jgi:pimeloyl-[acyl-carrier protein] methyl ester esterase